MRFAGPIRKPITFLAAAVALSGVACAKADDSASDGGAPAPPAQEAAPDAGTRCEPFPCGSQCCEGTKCWWVDATGAKVYALPTCTGPEAGPPAGPALSFVGNWSPVSGSGQETCTDGESTSLPPDTSAELTFVQTGVSTLEALGAGSASSCSTKLSVVGNVASAVPPAACEMPGTNGVTVYYTTFELTLHEPGSDTGDAAVEAGSADGGDAGAGVTLTWRLESRFTDAVKTCTSSLVYTLVRTP